MTAAVSHRLANAVSDGAMHFRWSSTSAHV